MTIEHAGPFLESAVFDGARANVMVVLCNYANDFGECFPSYEAIATAARCERETAMRQIKWLAERGCVDIMRGDERPEEYRKMARRANVFRVNLKMVRCLYSLIRMVKEAMGRDPKKRYQAVRTAASWAEQIIDQKGADALIVEIDDMVAKGDVRSLLPNGNSDERSPLNDRKGDIEPAKGDLTSPNPSIEPSIEPSPPAAETSSGEKVDDGEVRDPDETERIRKAELRVLQRWLLTGCVDRLDALPLRKISHSGLSRDQARAFGFGLSPPAVRKAASWANWAQDIVSGRPDIKPPIKMVAEIVAALREPIAGKSVSDRCDALRQRAQELSRNGQQEETPETEDSEAA